METKEIEKQVNEFNKELEKIAQSISDANVRLWKLIDKHGADCLIDTAYNLEQCTKKLKEVGKAPF